MPHMAINVLAISLRHDDSQTAQISHRVTRLCCQNGVQEFGF